MRAIVHVGQPKAGSSTIQQFLSENRDALARKGIRHDTVEDTKGASNQWQYACCALSNLGKLPRRKEIQNRLKARTLKEQQQYTRIYVPHLQSMAATFEEPLAVFSSERIMPLLQTPEEIGAFDKLFSEHFESVSYLVYLRNPEDQLASAYSERIKRGHSFEVDRFIERRKKSLDFYTPAKTWADTVGHDRLHVRLLDKSFLHQGDLLEDLCQLFGCTMEGLSRPEPANLSLTAPAIECLRALNAKFPEILPQGGANPLRAGLLKTVEELSTSDDPKFRFSPEQKERVRAYAAPYTEKLQKDFFPDREPLFSPTSVQSAPPDPADTRERGLELMAELVTRIRLGAIPGLSARAKRRAFRYP